MRFNTQGRPLLGAYARWLDNQTPIDYVPGTGMVNVDTGKVEIPGGVFYIAAGGGKWADTGGQMRSSFGYDNPVGRVWDIGITTGVIIESPSYQIGKTIGIWQQEPSYLTDQDGIADARATLDGQFVACFYSQRIWSSRHQAFASIPDNITPYTACLAGNLLLYHTTKYLVLQEFNRPYGRVIATATDPNNATFSPDMVVLANGDVKVGWCANAAETPDSYREQVFKSGEPLGFDDISQLTDEDPEPPLQLETPIVVVDNWTLNDVLEGNEFSFRDGGNPELGYEIRVWIEGGGMYGSIKNAAGEAETRKFRPVKPCSAVEPEPVPPEPEPEPEPPLPWPVPTPSIIFGSNLGALDFAKLATDPATWDFGRTRLSTMHLFMGHIIPNESEFVYPNAWPVLAELVKRLKEWGIQLEIGMNSGQGLPEITSLLAKVAWAEGRVGAIVFDHAFVQTSVEAWASRFHEIRAAYPQLLLGAFAPFPTMSTNLIRMRVSQWANVHALPAFLRMDIDYNQRQTYTAQTHSELLEMCNQYGLGLQVVINAKEGITDAEYVRQGKQWFDRALSLGRWDAMSVQAWASTDSTKTPPVHDDHHRTLPHNLPESDQAAHTNLLNYVIERYLQTGPVPPEPEPVPEPLPPPDSTTSLETDNKHFWCAQGGGGLPTTADPRKGEVHTERTAPDAWETFGVYRLGGNKVALGTSNGFYVTAEADGRMVATRRERGSWEQFEVEVHGSKVALKSAHGKYVCAEGGGGGELIANREAVGAWELFNAPGITSGGSGSGSSGPLGGRVSVDGRFWVNSLGTYRPLYISGFKLPGLAVQNPERVKQYLDLARSLGFNGVRVLAGALAWGPQTAEEARRGLPFVLAEAEKRNLSIEVTALSDSATGYDINSHMDAIESICKDHLNVLGEVANEPYHSTQASSVHDWDNLSEWGWHNFGSALVAWASGAPDTDEPDLEDYPIDGEWLSLHLDRSRPEWDMVRRVRALEEGSALYGCPAMNNEPIGWGEVAVPGRRNSNPSIAFTMGALSRGFEVGLVSHADHGLHCDDPGPVQLECHRSLVAGFRVYGTEARLVFKNAGWADSPIKSANFEQTIVRAYSFLDSDSHGWTVLVGLTGDPGLVWQNGWHRVHTVAARPGVAVMEISR